jgi:hypothetical protein
MNHTPGPWTTRESPEHWGRVDVIIHSEATDVATAWQGGTEANRANAKLIAAAPDLLEALEEALEDWEDSHFDEEYPSRIEWADKARAALKKAKG